MSRLRKTVIPFRWLTITANFTQGSASTVNVAPFLHNPQNRTITYSVVGSLPSGVTFSGSTLSYNGSGAASSASVQFRATSGSFVADSSATTVAITGEAVNADPVWVTAETLAGVQSGQAFSYTLTATDAESDAISFTHGAPPFGAITVQQQSGGTRSLVWAGTAPVVTADTQYTFTVDADDTPPLAQVTGLTATATSATTISLTWTAVTNATGYQLERSATGTGSWSLIGSPATASYTDTGLTASTAYWYRTRATNASQTGEYSGAASATTQAPPVAGGGVPAYISGLAPFQVAALSTVTNGHPTWITAVDPAFDTTVFSGGGNPATSSVKKIVVESGGFAVPEERKFYALGGGHADGAYNGILEFDLNGTTQATGWSVVPGSESAVADIPTTTGTATEFVTYLTGGNYATTPQAGGKAGSTHNYGAMVYDRESNRMVRFGGSYWSSGFGSAHSWFFDRTAGEWVPAPAHGIGSSSVYGAVFHDKETRKAIYVNISTARFFNLATGTWGGSFFNTGGLLSRVQGGYDSTRKRGIVIGKGMSKRYDINWAAETATISNFTFTAANPGDTEMMGAGIEGVGVEYDPVLDRFWIFGGRDNSGGSGNPAGPIPFNNLYWFEAADLDDNAVTVHSQELSQEIPRVQSGQGYFMGLYRRYCFIPEWRALAVATSYNQPVHVIRLPS